MTVTFSPALLGLLFMVLLSCAKSGDVEVLKEVTGPGETNCYLVYDTASKEAALIDVGDEVPALVETISREGLKVKYIFSTHGHMDHMGFLPYLFAYGYDGPVYCTPPTRDLMVLLQQDYINLMKKVFNMEPLYSKKDIHKELRSIITVDYNEVVDITPEIKMTLYNAGHILGSASVHLHIGEGAHNLVYTADQKFGFTKRIANNHIDVVLFSGGGNDIVGMYDLDLLLAHRNSSDRWQDCIHVDRLDNKLDLIESVYIEMMERVVHYSADPEVRVVSHNYDFCLPSPQGYELFDLFPIGESWIYPILKEKGFVEENERLEVVRFLLTRFGDRLKRLEQRYLGRFFIADTQGTLAPHEWRNEIHPTPAGFRKISRIIHLTIQKALAGG